MGRPARKRLRAKSRPEDGKQSLAGWLTPREVEFPREISGADGIASDSRLAERRRRANQEIHRLPRGSSDGDQTMGQYAIEVDKEHAHAFKIPGATILERAEVEENGTVGFIVRSRSDLRRSEVLNMPGVRGVEPL
jgi:hypothetical protein